MEYEILQLVKDVRVCLDENDVQNELLAKDSSTLQLDDIIRSKIEDAVNGVLMSAPLEMLGSGVAVAFETIEWDNGNAADDGELRMCRIPRPQDYLRLLCAKMPDWDYAVVDTISMHSDEYKMQKSRYSGMRGNPQRPIVADVVGKEGNYLELYTSAVRDIDFVRYLPLIALSSASEVVSLPHSLLYKVVVYQIAG